MKGRPGQTTVKTLFATSCNRCAFPECDLRLTDPDWRQVRADIAHIHGENPTSARYVEEMTDVERHSIDNLVLLCPNHHREVDRLRPQDWPAERLLEIKLKHEQRCENRHWATEADLDYYSEQLLRLDAETGDGRSVTASSPRSRLEVRDGPRQSFLVVNVGDADAFHVRVHDATVGRGGGMLHLEDAELERLSPGGQWTAGSYVRSAGGDNFVVRLEWVDDGGEARDAVFPLL